MSEHSPTTYIDESMLPFPFCPGCGHGPILEALNQALVDLAPDPHRVVLVTDIGCCGLSDKYFRTNALHGLHGRSVTYATGMKLQNPDLLPIVIIGDGGCGIGGHHLLNAARRNIGVTVLVFNNFNYGMTGGEQSVTTPMGGITTTTLLGSLEHPLDICGSVAANGAGFVARATSFDKDLPALLARAIQHDGFSLVDIWELCTSYYAPVNKLSKKTLQETMARFGFGAGVLAENERPEFSRALRQAYQTWSGQEVLPPQKMQPTQQSALQGKLRLIVAGAAGTRIGSAAATFARGAILSGLWVTQRHDYPVTVRTGHSVSELVLSSEEILYPGVEEADLMVVLFPEGLRAVGDKLSRMRPDGTVFVASTLAPLETPARQVRLDFKKAGEFAGKKPLWAIMALAEVLRQAQLYPLTALQEALASSKADADAELAAIEASAGLSKEG
jgi:2-oxoglutarate ferredoxin oxidoreductase subunit beta